MKKEKFLYPLIVVGMALLWPWAVVEVSASAVEVVRWDAAHDQWVFVGGDLVSPEPSPDGQTSSASIGSISIWDGVSLGPLFADVKFLDSGLIPIDMPNNQNGNVTPVLEPAESLDTSLPGFTGSLSGTAQPSLSFSGNINGTVNATATMTLEGTVAPTSAVPLPGTAWIFGSGLAALMFFCRYALSRI
jgi:hypothetical protein